MSDNVFFDDSDLEGSDLIMEPIGENGEPNYDPEPYVAEPIEPTYGTFEDDLLPAAPVSNELINALLTSKGISDPGAIKYENEAGEIEEVNFFSLPQEEQLQIILGQEEKPSEYTDDEIKTIEFLRNNKTSLADIVENAKKEALATVQQPQEDTFEIDSFSDEELYRLDLELRYKDSMSQEEIQARLDRELENPETFSKIATALRTEYKEQEAAYKEAQIAEMQAQENEQYLQFQNTMVDVAKNIDLLHSFQLEDSDKDEVLDFILSKDNNGVSEFAKAINNPEMLFKMAWYALKGDQSINALEELYKVELSNSRQNAKNTPPKSVVASNNNTPKPKPGSIQWDDPNVW